MPTPVTTARQCLTPESSQTLDAAVAAARRRVHAQTTSLHAVAALLSGPSSALREACARNTAYSSRVQFKALELCLGVALDRLPTRRGGREGEDPPVSNSLMAAIRRAQANQRRQPENFHLYQQQLQQQSSPVSTVKVEIQNFVLSILDDPVVSRVFGEAGFRSCDIKLAILRPLHQLLRYSHYRGPPMFLCNLTDENFRRIGDVLMKTKGRNPLLIGSCGHDALQSFCETLDRKKGGYFLPVEIFGLNVIHIGSDISKFVSEDYNEDRVKMRFKDVALMVEQCNGPGLIINYGDVKELTGDEATIPVSTYVIGELTRLLGLFGTKLWLIGAAASYEAFLKFLNRFPSVVKDWDLQLLPITSLKPSPEEAYPKSSLMESFVPLGGFFSAPSDLTSSLVGLNQCPSRCHLCNEKCEQEIHAISKQGCTVSVGEEFHYNVPSWLTEWSTKRPLEVVKTDDCMALSAKAKVVQQKWDNICQRLHHTSQLTRQNLYHLRSQVQPITNLRIADDTKKDTDNYISNESNGSSNISEGGTNTSQPDNPLSGTSTEMGTNLLSQKNGQTLQSNHIDLNVLGPLSSSNSSTEDGQTFPWSAASVTADFGLRTHSPSPNTAKESSNLYSPLSHPASISNFVQGDFKALYHQLSQTISWQEEAVSAISQAIAHCRMRNEKQFGTSMRGDIWFSFLGPDNFSKKKIAVALVEILYGSRGNFIHVDLNPQDRDLNGYDVKSRGKNVVDHIAWELSRKPFSVVLLENIDKADFMVQNSLSKAMRTAKFPDMHGREVSISNTVFVITSKFCKTDKINYSANEISNCLEESLLRAKIRPLQMIINCGDDSIVSNTSRSISCPFIVSKRKSIGITEIVKRAHKDPKLHLDLNLPPEEIESHGTRGDFEENSKVWFENFLELVDETVTFKPFDLEKFTKNMVKEIDECFRATIGSDCVLEVDSIAMEHILASVYLSEKNEFQDWVEQVLSQGFVDAQNRHNLTSHTVLKLSTREGFGLEEKDPGFCLPRRIIVEQGPDNSSVCM